MTVATGWTPANRHPTACGWAGRLGLVLPANNTVLEPELARALPDGVAFHVARVRARGDLTVGAVQRMEAEMDSAADMIVETGVDALAVCDMVTSFIMPPGWNEATAARQSMAHGIPCFTAWTSLDAALRATGARRLALGTPYPRKIHSMGLPFFAAAGYEVTAHDTLDILAMRDVPAVTGARLEAFVAGLDLSGAEAVVLLATDLPSFGSIDRLEAMTGLPVLTSNQAILWQALALLGRFTGQGAAGPGRLFRLSAGPRD
jgi:maleate isomerase